MFNIQNGNKERRIIMKEHGIGDHSLIHDRMHNKTIHEDLHHKNIHNDMHLGSLSKSSSNSLFGNKKK